MSAVRVLLVSGSTRAGSTGTAALRTAAAVAPPGVAAALWQGLVDLPAFVPGDPGDAPAVAALLQGLRDADAVLLCTPEYAGTLPGSLKNALDWTVGGGELHHRPVAWLSVAAPGRGGGALATLELVLGYVEADVVGAACASLPLRADQVGDDGLVHDPAYRQALAEVLGTLADHVRALRA